MRRQRTDESTHVAVEPATGAGRLLLLGVRSLGSRPLARSLAANPRLPKLLPWSLAPHCWDVRTAVASNPRCPHMLLGLLGRSRTWTVRAGVAGNPAAPPGLLGYLTSHEAEPCVRLPLAGNPSLSPVLVERLLADRDAFVRCVAAAHPAAPAAALSGLAEGMSQPAWILSRIAGNPACPEGLSDQLLTWIALGGAGAMDPAFDPVECTGHPGDTSTPVYRWYQETAKGTNAETHPLWQVRAAVLSARGKVPGQMAWRLARDARPEVRRVIAAANLPDVIRLELTRDADPAVARMATAAWRRRPAGARMRSRLRLILRSARPYTSVAWLAWVIISLVSRQSPQPSPVLVFGSPQPGLATDAPAPGTPGPATYGLPGGGRLTCWPSSETGSGSAQVTAGKTMLKAHFGGYVVNGSGRLLDQPYLAVAPGKTTTVLLTASPTTVTVTAVPGGATQLPVVQEEVCA